MSNNFGIFFKLLILFVFVAQWKNVNGDYIRACFWTNWSQFRLDEGKFLPEHYEPGVCTHIFYAFAIMNKNFVMMPGQWNDEDGSDFEGNYKKINNLKQKQPGLKTVLTFGGVDFSDDNANLLHTMASTSSNREKFINSTMAYLRKHNFDGFCLDWMYPRWEDKDYFSILSEHMRKAFTAEAAATKKPRLLLVTTVPGKDTSVATNMDADVLGKEYDFVCIETYNYHGPWENVTGFTSPLHDTKRAMMSISQAAEYWSTAGVPKSKLIIGLATYGRGWTLPTDTSNYGVGAHGIGPSPKQAYTIAPGVAAYYEICHLIENDHWTEAYDETQEAAYVYKQAANESVWIGYDNSRSYGAKLDWVKSHGYAGVHVWAVDMDDFRARCRSSGGHKYPLLKLVKAKLANEMTDKNQTENSNQETLTSTFACITDGLFSNPTSNSSYYVCMGNVTDLLWCKDGEIFDEAANRCQVPVIKTQQKNSGIKSYMNFIAIFFIVCISILQL